ncbi:hypothetical protein [Roseovarius pacificus]|uniref:hypothetical protein n=1 Tax=Roseovarius pacificus TaxID=337701 RepID=UPI002A189380|nr:hypothetical protein [Roseovarius pacificus]
MSRFSLADQVIFGFLNATLVFTLAYAVLGFGTQFGAGFAIEDGPIEYGTAVALFMASLVLFWRAIRLGRAARIGAGLLVAFYALIFVFGAGEEISWGQRIFGWETTEYFLENNRQMETNLHNLAFGEEQLAKTLFGSVLTTVLLLYLVVLPPLYPRVRWIAKLADALMVPVPGLRHTIIAVVASLLVAVVDLPRKWEVYEFIFGLLSLSIFIGPANSAHFDTSGAPEK